MQDPNFWILRSRLLDHRLCGLFGEFRIIDREQNSRLMFLPLSNRFRRPIARSHSSFNCN